MKLTSITNVLILTLIAILFIGCGATQAKIKVAGPMRIKSDDIRHLAIKDIKNDKYNLNSSLKTEFSKYLVDNKNYYTLYEYGDTNITPENAKTVMTTKILDLGVDKRIYKRSSDEFLCSKWKKINGKEVCLDKVKLMLSCVEKTFRLVAHINFERVSNGSSIYSAKYGERYISNECEDSGHRVETNREIYEILGDKLAKKIVLFVSPSYTQEVIELMEKPDIPYTSKQTKLLEDSLFLIKKNRMKDANEKLQALIEDTKYKSYVAFYNAGVTFEALGDLENAFNAYRQAKSMSMEDAIHFGYRRVISGMEIARDQYMAKQKEALENK